MLCTFPEKPEILQGWQKRFQYILIDEFQDINRVQYEVIRMLAAPRYNLFVVGMMISPFMDFVEQSRS